MRRRRQRSLLPNQNHYPNLLSLVVLGLIFQSEAFTVVKWRPHCCGKFIHGSFSEKSGKNGMLWVKDEPSDYDDNTPSSSAGSGGGIDEIEPDFREEDLQGAGVLLEDLSWRVEKLRLEEANTRRFLKAKPRFLPYKECSKWVQAFGRWRTAEEWESWIAMGEKRNSYIPSRPEEYYTRTGDWISWDHFLGVRSEENTEDQTKKE